MWLLILLPLLSLMSFSPLERRSVLAIASVFLIRMAGLFMLLPVFALYSRTLEGITPQLAGVAMGIHGVSQVLLQVPFGMLSDRFGRKPIVVAGALIFVAGSLLGYVADDVYTMMVARFLQGAGAISSVMMALLADLTSDDNRTQAMAMVGGAIGVSFALALVVGPIIAGIGGLKAVLGATVVSGILAVVLVIFLVPAPGQRKVQREHGTVVSELWSVALHPSLVPLNVGVMILHATMMACFIALPSVMARKLDIPSDQHGYWYLPALLVSFVFVIPVVVIAEKKRQMKSVFLAATLVLSLSLFVMMHAGDGKIWLVAGLLGYFWAFNLLEATLPSWVSKVAPAGSRGTAMGVYASAQFLGVFVGGVVAGYFMAHRGQEAVFLLMAGLGLVWSMVVLKSPPPRYLANWSLALPDAVQSADSMVPGLLNLPGVADAVLVESERMVYLKVDKALFRQEDARAFLGQHAGRQSMTMG